MHDCVHVSPHAYGYLRMPEEDVRTPELQLCAVLNCISVGAGMGSLNH